jgi:hypothetical protein
MLVAALRSAARLKSGVATTSTARPFDVLNHAAAATSRYFGSTAEAIENTISSKAEAGVSGRGRGRTTLRTAISALDDAGGGSSVAATALDVGGGGKRSSSSAFRGGDVMGDVIKTSSTMGAGADDDAADDAGFDDFDLGSLLDSAKGLSFGGGGGGDGDGGGAASSSASSLDLSAASAASNLSFGGADDTASEFDDVDLGSLLQSAKALSFSGDGGAASTRTPLDLSAASAASNLSFGGAGDDAASEEDLGMSLLGAMDIFGGEGSGNDSSDLTASLSGAMGVSFGAGGYTDTASASGAARPVERENEVTRRAAITPDSPYRESFFHRKRRGKTKLLIVGEEEARERRKQVLVGLYKLHHVESSLPVA